MAFTDFSKIDALKEFNTFLADKSYVEGYVTFFSQWSSSFLLMLWFVLFWDLVWFKRIRLWTL